MFLRRLVVFALAAAWLPAAWCQSFASKPVRVIVTFPPGGTPDIYGRVMSAELQKVWSQSVVVENRTGAGGTIGTDYVAKAAPDGYTLLFAADATITIAPHLYSKLPYDPVRDLAPIVNVAAGPFVLMANPAFPPNNVKELITLVQTQPGKVSYASSGAGGQQHLAMEYIRTMAGSMDMIHVPYKGFGQASPTCSPTRCRSSSEASPHRSSSPGAASSRRWPSRVPGVQRRCPTFPRSPRPCPASTSPPGTDSSRRRARRAKS